MEAVQSPGQPWPGGKRCRRRRFPGRKGPHGKGSAPRLMAPYTQQELEALLADLESDLVERKESLHGDNPRRIRQAVCAFANDLPDHQRPGVVFVGADDAGAPVNLEITDELLLQLADIKTDGNIVPPPTLTVDRRLLLGAPVAVVTVLPSDTPPVRHRGRIWIRVGPRRAVASAQDERILNEKRRHRDPHFDAQPVPTASVADLDLRRFEEEYLPLAIDATALAENDRSTEQRLAALKMIAGVDDPRPRTYEGTNAPIHVFWFDDRIEITSPGGPYGALTPENFGQPGIVDYRNQILAEAMRVLGLAQRYGAGIPTARRALLANGQPEPDFRVEANWVHCTVKART